MNFQVSFFGGQQCTRSANVATTKLNSDQRTAFVIQKIIEIRNLPLESEPDRQTSSLQWKY